MGRRKQKYLQYKDAIPWLRSNCDATNRDQYIKWHHRVDPGVVPRYPHRVYSEWSSWNDWLGTTNTFDPNRPNKVKKTYLPWWEAVRYAQAKAKEHNITTQSMWEEWHDSGMCDGNVPKRPHHVYEEFVGAGWGVWLGTKVVGKQKAAQNTEMIVAFHHHTGHPQNVIIPYVHSGYQSIVEKVKGGSLGRVYRMYLLEEGDRKIVERLLNHYGHKQDDGSYIIPNPHALIAECDMDLLLYKREG